jgi:hypothetical protein
MNHAYVIFATAMPRYDHGGMPPKPKEKGIAKVKMEVKTQRQRLLELLPPASDLNMSASTLPRHILTLPQGIRDGESYPRCYPTKHATRHRRLHRQRP